MSALSNNSIIYMPDKGTEKGVIQIIHGMSEHQGRYRELAQFFAENGYITVTSDLKGHGNNISRDAELGFFGDNAVSRLVSDIHDNTAYLKDNFADLPYVLMGHGIGALIAAIYTRKYDRNLDALFLSGMPANHKVSGFILHYVMMLLIALRGEYHRSAILNKIIMGRYYRPFYREGSEFSWLNTDSDSVLKYEEDPKCGYIYTFNGFQTILELFNSAYSKGSWIMKRPELPIRMFWGEDDTCIQGGADLSNAVHLFSDAGYSNTAYITYPGQRHEIFGGTNKLSVWEDALKELNFLVSSSKKESGKTSVTPHHIVLEGFMDPEVDKPLVRDEKLNLDEFIQAHNEKTSDHARPAEPEVEMIDFASSASSSGQPEENVPEGDDTDFDAMIDELLNKETYAPEVSRRPLDDFDGFKIDPNIMDGIRK